MNNLSSGNGCGNIEIVYGLYMQRSRLGCFMSLRRLKIGKGELFARLSTRIRKCLVVGAANFVICVLGASLAQTFGCFFVFKKTENKLT